jgi:hypothetical protein
MTLPLTASPRGRNEIEMIEHLIQDIEVTVQLPAGMNHQALFTMMGTDPLQRDDDFYTQSFKEWAEAEHEFGEKLAAWEEQARLSDSDEAMDHMAEIRTMFICLTTQVGLSQEMWYASQDVEELIEEHWDERVGVRDFTESVMIYMAQAKQLDARLHSHALPLFMCQQYRKIHREGGAEHQTHKRTVNNLEATARACTYLAKNLHRDTCGLEEADDIAAEMHQLIHRFLRRGSGWSLWAKKNNEE